jgi:hypothetical protein
VATIGTRRRRPEESEQQVRAQHQIGDAVITVDVGEETQPLDDGLLLRR